jgi:hypothetical protein
MQSPTNDRGDICVAVLSNDDSGAILVGEYLRDIVSQW